MATSHPLYLPKFLCPEYESQTVYSGDLFDRWQACTTCQYSSPERRMPTGQHDASNLIIVKSSDSFPVTPLKMNMFNQFLFREGIDHHDYMLVALYHCMMHGKKVNPEIESGCLMWLNVFFQRLKNIDTIIVSGNEVARLLFRKEIEAYMRGTAPVQVTYKERVLNLTLRPSYLRKTKEF